jgi:hypothetical protein
MAYFPHDPALRIERIVIAGFPADIGKEVIRYSARLAKINCPVGYVAVELLKNKK